MCHVLPIARWLNGKPVRSFQPVVNLMPCLTMWRSISKRKGLVVLQHHQAVVKGKLVSKMTKAIVSSAAFFALLLMVEPVCTFIDSLPPVLNMTLVCVMVGAVMLTFWRMMRRELELCEGHYER